MDSCASCCFIVSSRLEVLRAGRSVFRDNPFPSPCFLWHLNAGCGDLLCHPFGHFGLNFPWLLWQRETVVPPNSHSLSLSRAGTGTGEWLLNQGPRSCIWVPPCNPAHWCSILWSDITSLAAQKTLWGSSMISLFYGKNIGNPQGAEDGQASITWVPERLEAGSCPQLISSPARTVMRMRSRRC